MIIGSVIIALSYNLVTSLYENWKAFQKKQDSITEMLFFKRTLEKDIDQCNYVVSKSRKKYCLISGNDTIFYLFDQQIERIKDRQTDTFFIVTEDLSAISVAQNSEHLVKSISMRILKPVEVEQTTFTKAYSSSQLMNTIFSELL
jgi:hypothetical protein